MALREQVLRGGAYLTIRQVLVAALALGGTLLLTQILGPVIYGLYFTAFGTVFLLYLIAGMGIDVYLVRREDNLIDTVYHQAFSFLLLSSLGMSLIGFLVSPLITDWLNDTRVLTPLWGLLILLPVTVLPVPAIAQLERALDYRKIAFVEIIEQALNYSIAMLLAWFGCGIWALVIGYGISRLWLLIGSYKLARYRPRWYWSSILLGPMLSYGFSFSASIWISQFRRLSLFSLIIGRYVGPEGVGYVTLTLRLIEGMSFVSQATWRLSIAALSKVQANLPRLRAALEEATALQVLALGPLLVVFALLSPFLVPLLFGERWTPILLIYPFIALASLVNTSFNMQVSVLHVVNRNSEALLFNVTLVVILAGTGIWLVPWLGLLGWGLAEVVGLASYAILHRQVNKLFAVSYARAAPWLIAFIPPLFTPLVGWPIGLALWLSVLAVPCSRNARIQLQEYWTMFGIRFINIRNLSRVSDAISAPTEDLL